jgi:two-component system, NtrC family, response regulator AtoC
MQILVVDDERVVFNTVVTYLSEQGHDVGYCSDADQALKVLREESPELVLTDVRMPGMDGLALLKEIKELDDSIDVILMSGFGDMDLVIEAQRGGAFDFIKKPIDFRELNMALERTSRFHKVRKQRQQARSQIELMERSGGAKGLEVIIGESQLINDLKKMIGKVARTERTTVLITGETGTGKELVARAIHKLSSRADNAFIPVNCTSLSHGLAESELFGHEPGAFTGAQGRKAGFFELADGGTLFLDEIGDMDLSLQSKLLRALEQFSFFRVGGKKEIKVDVRVVAATNRDLHQMAADGDFRLDLLHRLEVFILQTPTLRSIPSDIERFNSRFISAFNNELGTEITGIDSLALSKLQSYAFPGNIRELRNMIERAMILAESSILEVEDFPNLSAKHAMPPHTSDGSQPDSTLNLAEMEKQLLLRALEQTKGVKSKAAVILGISRESLRRRMEKHDLETE